MHKEVKKRVEVAYATGETERISTGIRDAGASDKGKNTLKLLF